MKVQLPDGCGNAPRISIVADFAAAWARGDTEYVAQWLTDDIEWTVVGGHTLSGPGHLAEIVPDIKADSLNLHSVITHGRLGSCDGVVDGRLSFSHVFRFKTTGKTSKIAQIRTYVIELDQA